MEEKTEQPVPVKFWKRPVSLGRTLMLVTLVGALAFIGGTRAVPWINSLRYQAAGELDLSSLQTLYGELRENYDGQINPVELVDGAKHGMVEAVGDPYTVYFNQDEADAFLSDLEGEFEGIGAELGRRDDKLMVIAPLEDSPASRAGLRANDIIYAVNDQSSVDWSTEKAVSEIRGEKGTTVKLTIIRGDEAPRDISITRDTINNPSVKAEVTDGNIGVLRISRFGETDTVRLARAAAQDFKDRGVSGVVLDLRGNGGGYLSAARDVAGLWLDDKVVVTERRGGEVTDTLRSGRGAPLADVPTVVLVDGGSASASEIVAGALRDNDAATIVGQKTFGKGSVQSIESLPSGGQLKVTIAKWFTPAGKNITQEGIAPDVEVELSEEDFSAGRDPQYDRALEIVKQ